MQQENVADCPQGLVLSLALLWEVPPRELSSQVSWPVAFKDFLVLPKAFWLLCLPVPCGASTHVSAPRSWRETAERPSLGWPHS